MKDKYKPFLILTVILIIGAVAWAGVAVSLGFLKRETEEFLETYPVENNTSVTVKNKNGDITITVWDEDKIEVYGLKKTYWGEKELEKASVSVTKGIDFLVETSFSEKFVQVSVDLRISVPPNVTVSTIKTSDGDIDLEGTKGELIVTTSNGEISVIEHRGNITVDSSNDDVYLRDITGNVDAETSNGRIYMERISGEVYAESDNEDIIIKDAEAVKKASTSNGDVRVEFYSIPEKGSSIRSSNGDIKVYIPTGMNASLEMKTSNGEIELHDLRVLTDDISEKHIEGDLGAGGPKLYLRTSNGDIDLYGVTP